MSSLNLARCNLITEHGLTQVLDHATLSSLGLYGLHHAMRGSKIRLKLARRGVAVAYRLLEIGNVDDTPEHEAIMCSSVYSDSRECECATVLCSWCLSDVVECLLADHTEMCRESPRPCPCCSDPVPRSQIAEHYEKFCDKYTVACPECSLFLPRHDIPRHLHACAMNKARLVTAWSLPGCPLRATGCLARGEHDHIRLCARYIVRCACGDEMPRSVYEAHLSACLTGNRPICLPKLGDGSARSRARYALDRRREAHRLRREGTHYFVNFQGEEVDLFSGSSST